MSWKMNKKAITLYEEGYPLEVVKDRRAVDYAYDTMALGQWYFDFSHPLQKNMGTLGTLILSSLILILLVVPLGYAGGFLYRRFRPATARAPAMAAPPSYPVYGVRKNEPHRDGGIAPPPAKAPPLPPGAEAGEQGEPGKDPDHGCASL